MKKCRFLFWIILLLIAACELLLAWRVKGFSDFYVRYIFPYYGATYGRVTGLFGFSVGELLLYFAVVYTVFTVVVWIMRFVAFVCRKEKFKALSRINSKIFFRIAAFIVIVQIQNCFVLYHTTPLYEGTPVASYEATREDLIDLRETLAKRANELATQFERNSRGEIIYDADIESLAKITMQGIGEEAVLRINASEEAILDNRLRGLSGYYSKPKTFLKSDFFSQQDIKGYYFPFTLEANYNKLMYISNKPATICHELAHLKGFIFEDEANFIAYLACMESNDLLFNYSATLDALSYVSIEVKKELAIEPEIRNSLTNISDVVIADSVFLTEEAWAEVEKDALLDTEFVSKASEDFLETNLTANGVEDGIVSYSRMVDLLLKYYYGEEIR